MYHAEIRCKREAEIMIGSFYIAVGLVILVATCAYFSFKNGTLYGAECALEELEKTGKISIDDDGGINAI